MSLTLNIIRVVVQDSVIQHLVIQQKHQYKRCVSIYSAGPENSLKIKKLSNKRVLSKEIMTNYIWQLPNIIFLKFSVYKTYSFFPSSCIEYYLFLKRKLSNSMCVYVSMCLCLVYSSTL